MTRTDCLGDRSRAETYSPFNGANGLAINASKRAQKHKLMRAKQY
jgi:hypothetical protein